jgi:nicotinamidase/pyrazinamidase
MMAEISDSLKPGDALLIIDVQKDFCPGGALPVENGDKIVPVINHWIVSAVARSVPVFATRDWHPLGHMSFKEHGGPWPPHCIQDSDGAKFHPALALPSSIIIVTKGVRFDQDQNSAFDQTGLAVQLRKDGIRRLWVAGLAEDVCVLATVMDACGEGFEVVLIAKATRSITSEGGEKARRQMQDAGARILT